MTQVSSSGLTTGYDNERSWAYEYDGLDRLVGAELGAWNGSSIVASTAIADPRVTTWDLDTLGNWSDGSPRVGRTVSGEVILGTSSYEHTVQIPDVRNAIDVRAVEAGPDGQSTTLVETTFHHDASGNLVSDGVYFYQHDAWGRVVSVHEIGTYDPVAGTGALGDLICQFSYGGLGRLTRKLSPFPGEPNEYRTEHYYYDGVRRVQEEWSDPINAFSPFTSEEESGMFPATWVEREYVHGPGYVDEYVCQIDGSARLAYILQDANYNVLALANDNGQVIEQLLWSPYGELLARESYLTFGLNKIGHQGLFFDRFDVPVTQSGLALQTSGVPPDGLFYNRERSYLAKLARFVQADPNGTARPVLGASCMLGAPVAAGVGRFDASALHRDGMNLYAALRANPLNQTDPAGLFGLLGGLFTSGFMALDALDAMDMAATGVSLQMGVAELWTGYALGQLSIIEDLMDWSVPDDEFGFTVNQGGIMSAGYAGLGSMFIMEFKRNHGGPAHNAKIDDIARKWKESGKYSKIYKNRGLRGKNGEIIFGSIRPDIQGVLKDGSGVDVQEVVDTNPSSRARKEAMQLIRAQHRVGGRIFKDVHIPRLPGRR